MYKLLLPLLLVFVLLVSGCRETIVHDLSEKEANQLLSELVNKEFEVKKEKQADSRWSLSLPENQASKAIRFLSSNKLLKEDSELSISKNSLVSSKEEQRFMLERAISRELEKTLSSMPGILQARVHLNLPTKDALFPEEAKPGLGTASVYLLSLDSNLTETDIKSLITGASGIQNINISVVHKIKTASTENSNQLASFTSEKVVKPQDSNFVKIILDRYKEFNWPIPTFLTWLLTLLLATGIFISLLLKFIFKRPKLVI